MATPIAPAMVAALLSLLFSISPSVRADSTGRDLAEFASGAGNLLFLGAAVGLPLIRDGKHGTVNALRAVDAIGTSTLICEGLKLATKEKRPDSDEHDSFPSGHTTAAFAAATIESAFHPREALYWYAGATAIGFSRIRLNRHHPQDVVAGALLGFGVTRWELSEPHGLILAPLIEPAQHRIGISLTMPLH